MFDLVPSVLAFALAMTITPGPNNIMVMASGLNFGYRRTVPHMLGISVGFPVMLVAVGAGLGALIQGQPDVQRTLSYVGAAYLLWLAWKIAVAAAPEAGAVAGRPIGFFQAAGFQWVNPKAWVLAIGATVTYTVLGEAYTSQVLVIALIFLIFGAPCIMLWLWFGASLKNILRKPEYVKIFNLSMATLLMLSLIPVFMDLFKQFTS